MDIADTNTKVYRNDHAPFSTFFFRGTMINQIWRSTPYFVSQVHKPLFFLIMSQVGYNSTRTLSQPKLKLPFSETLTR